MLCLFKAATVKMGIKSSGFGTEVASSFFFAHILAEHLSAEEIHVVVSNMATTRIQ